MQMIGPFGKDNPTPTLLMRGARVVRAVRVGARRDHLKMQLAHESKVWDAIAFKQGDKAAGGGDILDVVYNPTLAGSTQWRRPRRFPANVLSSCRR